MLTVMAAITLNVLQRVLFFLAVSVCCVLRSVATYRNEELNFGRCRLVIQGTCPDPDVQFFLYTRRNPTEAQPVEVYKLRSSNFNSSHPTKLIIHGYNSDMDLDVLVDIRKAYLEAGQHNIIAVDWSRLCTGPCYPSAVYNAKFTGKCIAQIVDALRMDGASQIHILGFSLGAHVAAFTANNLRPYILPRITGLDPAMPFFVTVNKDQKLDASDAVFVDVIHTNAFVQGKIEASGDVDFYVNGGIRQPGCWSESNPFGCDHHRAPAYFAESITSNKGFWGWYCPSFTRFLLGLCPPRYPAVIMGDKVPSDARGFYLVMTGAKKPFALGKWVTSPQDDLRRRHRDKIPFDNAIDKEVDYSWYKRKQEPSSVLH